MRIRSRSLAFALLACCGAALGSGCATVLGTAAGPVTAPVSFLQHTRGTPTWTKPFGALVVMPLGPVLGLATGIAADLGFVRNGAYGVDRAMPFEAVFDPSNPEWGRADPVVPERAPPARTARTAPGGDASGEPGAGERPTEPAQGPREPAPEPAAEPRAQR